MSKTRTAFIGGNWKMNGNEKALSDLAVQIAEGIADCTAEVAIFPSFVYLPVIAQQVSGYSLMVGGQNHSQYESGAYTGEISAAMLKDVACSHVLLGHSERRQLFAESNERIAEKFVLAQQHGLCPVLCVGETLAQRQADETEKVVLAQLDAVVQHAGVEAFKQAVVAYEPVWAIGTGQTASAEQAQAVHQCIRQYFVTKHSDIAEGLRVIYGGSVKPANAEAIFAMPDIDGGLIGGASLKAADFLAIVAAAK